jgi:hypothetical protein
MRKGCEIMKFISSRELSIKPSKVYKELERSGKLIVNHNGKPRALMLNIDEDSFEGLLAAVNKALAEYHVSLLRERAKEKGLDELTDTEIENIIKKARQKARR